MLTHSLSFCAGAAGFAAVTYAAGFHGSAWTFAAGFVCAAIMAAGALASRRRLKAAARFLESLAAVGTDRPARTTTPRAPRTITPVLSGPAADVADALQQLGAKRKEANTAAQAAAAANPSANFEELLRAALRTVQTA